jgi:hypothetical protein
LSGKIEIKHNSNDNTIIQNNQISCAPADITLSNKIFTGYHTILEKGIIPSISINLFKNASYNSDITEHNFYDFNEQQIMHYSNNAITFPVCSNKCKWKLISENKTMYGVKLDISAKEALNSDYYSSSDSYTSYYVNTDKNKTEAYEQKDLQEQHLVAVGEVSVPDDKTLPFDDEITLQFEYTDGKYIYAKKEICIYATLKETSIQTDNSNVQFNITDKIICDEIKDNEKPSAMLEFYYDNISFADLEKLAFTTLEKNNFSLECYNSQNKLDSTFQCSIPKIFNWDVWNNSSTKKFPLPCFELKILYSPQFNYWNNSDDGNYTLKVFKNSNEFKTIRISLSKTLICNNEEPKITLNKKGNFVSVTLENPKFNGNGDINITPSITNSSFTLLLSHGSGALRLDPTPYKTTMSKNTITHTYRIYTNYDFDNPDPDIQPEWWKDIWNFSVYYEYKDSGDLLGDTKVITDYIEGWFELN